MLEKEDSKQSDNKVFVVFSDNKSEVTSKKINTKFSDSFAYKFQVQIRLTFFSIVEKFVYFNGNGL